MLYIPDLSKSQETDRLFAPICRVSAPKYESADAVVWPLRLMWDLDTEHLSDIELPKVLESERRRILNAVKKGGRAMSFWVQPLVKGLLDIHPVMSGGTVIEQTTADIDAVVRRLQVQASPDVCRVATDIHASVPRPRAEDVLKLIGAPVWCCFRAAEDLFEEAEEDEEEEEELVKPKPRPKRQSKRGGGVAEVTDLPPDA